MKMKEKNKKRFYCSEKTDGENCRFEKNGEGKGPKFRPCKAEKAIKEGKFYLLPFLLHDCCRRYLNKNKAKDLEKFIQSAAVLLQKCFCPKHGRAPIECPLLPLGGTPFMMLSKNCREVISSLASYRAHTETLKEAQACLEKNNIFR